MYQIAMKINNHISTFQHNNHLVIYQNKELAQRNVPFNNVTQNIYHQSKLFCLNDCHNTDEKNKKSPSHSFILQNIHLAGRLIHIHRGHIIWTTTFILPQRYLSSSI